MQQNSEEEVFCEIARRCEKSAGQLELGSMNLLVLALVDGDTSAALSTAELQPTAKVVGWRKVDWV